jgi:hypothetical protein
MPLGRTSLVRTWIVWWLLCGALWMVLDDTTAIPELVDGAVSAAIGATAATLVSARSPVRFAPRVAWGRRWWVPLVQFVTDLPILVGVLARVVTRGDREPGGLIVISFTIESDPDARAAQIALASVAGSFAPNTIVVAVDEAAQVLIAHELMPTQSRTGADPLGLG